jgi:hypothetical protein
VQEVQEVQEKGELVAGKTRRALRNLVDDVAALGSEDQVKQLLGILLEMGDSVQDHKKIERVWQRKLEKAKPEKNNRARLALVKKIGKVVRLLEQELVQLEGEEQLEGHARLRLAAVILKLDSTSELANQVVGYQQYQGEWLPVEAVRLKEGSTYVAGFVQKARQLEIVVEHSASQNPTARYIYGDSAHKVSAFGVTLHGGIDASRLERILRESLRAIAFSNAILNGKLEVPKFEHPYQHVMLQKEEHYDLAIQEAHENDGLSEERYGLQQSMRFHWFHDKRGWIVDRIGKDSMRQALILTQIGHFYPSKSWLPSGTQPCFLAGHLSWLALNFFGAPMPSTLLIGKGAPSPSTVSEKVLREETLWQAASTGLFGCRTWMKSRMKAGDRFPFALTIVDQMEKVQDEPLLKAMLVNEYLQVSGTLTAVLAETRSVDEGQSVRSRIEAIEAAFGKTLPEFDAVWATWLQTGEGSNGFVQSLAPGFGRHSKESDPRALAMLEKLQEVREQAFGPLNVWYQSIELFSELSLQAQKHAQYLVLNPGQGEVWPDAHEEYPDCEGFSPEGAWAGQHSVIDFTSDPVAAVDRWMGTFYHRLSLLEQGLFGVGYGGEKEVTVLDVTSLVIPDFEIAWVVWPIRNMKNVPRKFQPELPNPVPGEDQSTWGYPITLQAYWDNGNPARSIEMQLFSCPVKDIARENLVPCHFLSPTTAKFTELVPPNAYCLIPLTQLKANTIYSVVATCPETKDKQTWQFQTGS